MHHSLNLSREWKTEKPNTPQTRFFLHQQEDEKKPIRRSKRIMDRHEELLKTIEGNRVSKGNIHKVGKHKYEMEEGSKIGIQSGKAKTKSIKVELSTSQNKFEPLPSKMGKTKHVQTTIKSFLNPKSIEENTEIRKAKRKLEEDKEHIKIKEGTWLSKRNNYKVEMNEYKNSKYEVKKAHRKKSLRETANSVNIENGQINSKPVSCLSNEFTKDTTNSRKGNLYSSKLYKKKQNKSDVKLLLNRSESFEKYGLVLPSFDKIKTDMVSLDDERATLDHLHELMDVNTNIPESINILIGQKSPPMVKKKYLGCKNLPSKDMNMYFFQNFEYIEGIFKGEVYSERHRLYHKGKSSSSVHELTYNTSMVVFTDDQKEYLLKLLCEKLDLEDKLTDYFFKVLLPEICLKIFMDVHNMTREDATQYLDSIPVDVAVR